MLLNAFKSIYRQAYVKGIASAVVLTAGLAAGQASALEDDILNKAAWETEITAELNDITVDGVQEDSAVETDGHYTKLQIAETVTNNTAFTVTISSGSAAAGGNYVSGSSAAAKVSGANATLIIEASADDSDTVGLLVGGSNADSLSLKDIQVKSGIIDIASGSVTAGTLSIGTGEAFSSLKDVTSAIKLGTSTTLGNLDPDQNTGSTINLNGGGKLLVDDESAQVTGAKVKGKTLNINGGAIVFGKTAASNASDLTVSFADGQMTDGYIGVSSGDKVTLELNGMTVESKTQAASFVASEGTINVAGTLELTSNANATAGAVYDFTSSGLNLISRNGDDNDSASALTGSGSIVVSGGATGAKATLLISKDNLNDFLTDNATDTADAQDNAGAVVVGGNGVLELDGTETYDLADTDDFKWTGSAAAGKIYVNSGTVKAENILLSKALSDNTATAFNIEAANLTVGSDSQVVDDGDFKFNTATVTNSLTLDAYTGESSVKLADTYNFTRPLDEGQKNPGESATRGSIGGDDMVLVANGSVIITSP